MRHSILALAILLLSACGSSPGTEVCRSGATACFGDPNAMLSCVDGAWQTEACGDGQLCHDGACQPLTCIPRAKSCVEGRVVTCSGDGSVWSAPERCPPEELCEGGQCMPVICDVGAARCTAGIPERCHPSGTRWDELPECEEGTSCVGGTCLADTCTAGERTCGPGTLFTCGVGGQWIGLPCPAGQPCVFGTCVECLNDAGCPAGSACEGSMCVETRPVVRTDELPPGTTGQDYAATIETRGGLQPYTVSLSAGSLPEGLSLADSGAISGRPTTPGSSSFTVEVTDARGHTATASFTLDVLSQGELRLTTTSLRDAELDYDYDFQLQAAGGVPPYAWQSLQPLPGGLAMASGGRIRGVPTELGDFPLTLRVLDVRTPPGYDQKDFILKVKIAPLEIIGDNEINLLLTKVIPLSVLIPNPILPYSTNLRARGGLRPYTWSVQPPPPGLGAIIPKWGLPDGLTLAADGRLSGVVDDISDAITIGGQFGIPSLTGYFFNARVTDSQNPAVFKEAIFFVPTVPLF